MDANKAKHDAKNDKNKDKKKEEDLVNIFSYRVQKIDNLKKELIIKLSY